ncbi:MAG: hypothetical protein V3V85_02460 [Candidatus Thorarchaeota archaeon]
MTTQDLLQLDAGTLLAEPGVSKAIAEVLNPGHEHELEYVGRYLWGQPKYLCKCGLTGWEIKHGLSSPITLEPEVVAERLWCVWMTQWNDFQEDVLDVINEIIPEQRKLTEQDEAQILMSFLCATPAQRIVTCLDALGKLKEAT